MSLSRFGQLFFDATGSIPRKAWWLGVGCIIFVLLLLSIVPAVVAFKTLSDPDGGKMVAFHRFYGWWTLLSFLLVAYPLYAISIKRRRDRGNSGWDVKLCLLLNLLLLLGQAGGKQWVMNYGGVGFSMREAPGIPGLILPLPDPVFLYFSHVVSVVTLAMVIPLGLLKGSGILSGRPAESFPRPRAVVSRRTSRTGYYGLAALSLVAVAVVAGVLSLRAEANDIAIGEPLPGHIAAVMSTQMSGRKSDLGTLTVLPTATIRNRRGQHCRSFSLSGAATTLGVACKRNGKWIATFAVSAQSKREMEESQAAHLKAIGASIPFSEEGERLVFRL